MLHEMYPQYTSKWTNVLLDRNKPVTPDVSEWLHEHEGGRYHIHRSGTAVKFERELDAELFILRWV